MKIKDEMAVVTNVKYLCEKVQNENLLLKEREMY